MFAHLPDYKLQKGRGGIHLVTTISPGQGFSTPPELLTFWARQLVVEAVLCIVGVSNTPDLHLLDANTSPVETTKTSPDMVQMSPEDFVPWDFWTTRTCSKA